MAAAKNASVAAMKIMSFMNILPSETLRLNSPSALLAAPPPHQSDRRRVLFFAQHALRAGQE
jgi:hypothetical protein